MKIEKAILRSEIKKAGDGTYEFIMSDETIDREGEVIKVDGWDLRNFKENNILLWGHRHDIPGVGVVGRAMKEDGKLVAKSVRFASEGIYDLADTVHGLVDDKVLKAVSVGYIPKKRSYPKQEEDETAGIKGKRKPRVITEEAELYELSIVNVGMNPNALAVVKSAEERAENDPPAEWFDETFAEKAFGIREEIKGVIPYHDYGKAPEGEAWDAGAEVRAASVEDLKAMCAWVETGSEDNKTAYKLPHHKAKGHAAVWRGIAAAMAALLGGRGGVDIPSGDRKGVYNHLGKHYAAFDKEVPEFKEFVEEGEEKPYANEHACRLLEPISGAPTRRKNGEGDHNGKKYDVIYQQQKDDTWKRQAFRYPKDNWTASEARSHCKSHDGIAFEPAAESSIGEIIEVTAETVAEKIKETIGQKSRTYGKGFFAGGQEPHIKPAYEEKPNPFVREIHTNPFSGGKEE
jgi:hypothetical protein